jgi:hypothetical protein
VQDFTAQINGYLTLDTVSSTEKKALCFVVERVLHDTGNYKGFSYLNGEKKFHYEPDAPDFDEYRRMYYLR